MGISRDVGQDLFGAGEGRFGVDPPFCLSGGSDVALEGAAVTERLQAPVEGQLLGVEGFLQRGKEQPTEKTSEHADGEKEVGPAGDPTAAVGRETATGDDAMQVGMARARDWHFGQ
jgi:hypothetical protein